MEACLLCMESVKSTADCILVDSEEWNKQNMKDIIDIHLWPMQQISKSSWICTECGTILYDFHKFYQRIKTAQQNFIAVLKEEDEVDEDESNKNLDFKDGFNTNILNDGNVESHIFMEQPLPTEFLINEPYIKSQTEDNLALEEKEHNSNKKRGRGRPAKGTTKHIKQHKDPLTKIKQISRQSKSLKKLLVTVKTNIRNNETDYASEQANSPILLDIKDTNESETDSEHNEIDEISTKTTKRKNHRNLDEKILKEYDQIIADNFKIFCNLCQIEMDNFLTLRRHFKVEHKQRGYARCCKRNFFTRSLLVDHIHVHLNPEYFKCHQCSKVFSDRSRLICHKKLHEDDSKLDKCNICGKLFADKGALKKHVLTHSSQKMFPCKICNKFFTNSFILNHHVEAVHQNKFVQICDICGKSIRCPTAFASHMEKHEVKQAPISCDVCGLLLTNKEGLKRHKNSQHPEGGKKEHTCHICSKVSPTPRALKSHIRSVHEQGFDFKCNLCEKSFKRPAVLREHMATHTGTALYTCPWCPRTFISNGNMYNHRKNAHPKEWEELKKQKYAGNVS